MPWIMACVSNINYAMIINGYPTHFFRARWGLRHGYSLSPLLFILAMDNLRLQIKKVVNDDQFHALVIGNDIKISHGFFIDDVLIMGMLNHLVWLNIFHIFKKNRKEHGLNMNLQKSIVYHDMSNMEVIDYIRNLLGIKAELMQTGIKYLGYHNKPSCYRNIFW